MSQAEGEASSSSSRGFHGVRGHRDLRWPNARYRQDAAQKTVRQHEALAQRLKLELAFAIRARRPESHDLCGARRSRQVANVMQ